MPDEFYPQQFAVKNLFFTDTASVFIQTKNKSGKSVGELILDPTYADKPKISQQYLNHLSTFSEFPVGLYREKYFAEAEKREFYPDYETILIEDVEVIEKRKLKDKLGYEYGDAEVVIEVTEKDENFFSVLNFLEMRDGKLASSKLNATKKTNNAIAVPQIDSAVNANITWPINNNATAATNTCLSFAFFSP